MTPPLARSLSTLGFALACASCQPSSDGGVATLAETAAGGAPLLCRSFASGLTTSITAPAVDAASNVLLAGSFRDTLTLGPDLLVSHGGWDGFVAKVDARGRPLWSKHFGDADDQGISAITVAPAGQAFVVGAFKGSLDLGTGPLTSDRWSVYVAKLDQAGRGIWSRQISPDADSNLGASAARATPSGGVVVVGSVDGRAHIGEVQLHGIGRFAIGFGADGTPLWGNLFSRGSDAMDSGTALDSAGYLALGESWSTGKTVTVTKLGPDGDTRWRRRFRDISGAQEIWLADVAVDAQGDVLASGGGDVKFGVPRAPGNEKGRFIARFDPWGVVRWVRPVPAGVACSSMAIAPTGDILCSGRCDQGFCVARLSPEIDAIWMRSFAGEASLEGMAVGPGGEAILAGTFRGMLDLGLGPLSSGERTDVFLAKLAP